MLIRRSLHVWPSSITFTDIFVSGLPSSGNIFRHLSMLFLNILFHSHGLINAPKVLADVVESTIGAVFIDCNYSVDRTWEVASDLLEPIITPDMLEKNPVKKLFEICKKHKLKVKLGDLWSQEGTYQVCQQSAQRERYVP